MFRMFHDLNVAEERVFRPDGGRKQLGSVQVDDGVRGSDAKLAEHRKRDFKRQQGGTVHCSARHRHTVNDTRRPYLRYLRV